MYSSLMVAEAKSASLPYNHSTNNVQVGVIIAWADKEQRRLGIKSFLRSLCR